MTFRISDVFKEWQKLGKMRDVNEWLMFPSTVNAYFNPPANEIVFPAGILRPPFFAKDWYVSRLELSELVIHGYVVRPVYLQYGAFGQVAAHELTVRMYLI